MSIEDLIHDFDSNLFCKPYKTAVVKIPKSTPRLNLAFQIVMTRLTVVNLSLNLLKIYHLYLWIILELNL